MARAAKTGTGRVLDIRQVGDPGLRTACLPVEAFDAQLAGLVSDMMATMNATGGVGLAANQVGVALQVFVYSCPDARGARRIGHVVNPELAFPDPKETTTEGLEGCLSLPGAHSKLARPTRAVVTGVDLRGRPVTVDGTGVLARCLAHEVDHLRGVLYIDLLGRIARAGALRQSQRHRAGLAGPPQR